MRPSLFRLLCIQLTLLISVTAVSAEPRSGDAAVQFNRDIRPIFSDKCFTCHGPDESKRMSALRLDTEEGAFADLGGRFAIVAGDPDKSELIKRVTHENLTLRMPPDYSGKSLNPEEIERIRQWVSQGAEWETHWAYRAPKRPPLPAIEHADWPKNEIDHFIVAKLENEGLEPSPEADRARLLRRVTLDLTGLPPTLEELDQFLADDSPDAYSQAVDRLLGRPGYGERMAVRWLDAARYADTNGYQTDAERYMWRWRDWVIDAFNKNEPFDRFTVEQLAGDLLPNPTLEQMIATGFNRNHRANGEGGIIAAEYAVEYVVDRLETTSTVWLGATLGCARCHDHKYDPFSQKDFYRFYAYFNNIPERGKAFKYGNSPPLMPAPTAENLAELEAIDGKLKATRLAVGKARKKDARAFRLWEASLRSDPIVDWVYGERLEASISFDDDANSQLTAQGGELRFAEGRVGKAVALDGKTYVEAGDIGNHDMLDKFSVSFWVYPETENGPLVTRTDPDSETEGRGYDGWGVYLKAGKVQVNFVGRWLDDCLRVETVEPIELNRWQHIAFTYDGSRLGENLRVFVDGELREMKIDVDEMNQFFAVKEPLRLGAGGGPDARFKGRFDDVRIYSYEMTPREIGFISLADTLNEIAALPEGERSDRQNDKLNLAFLNQYSPDEIRTNWLLLRRLTREREDVANSFPTVMVMREREDRRPTNVLIRGAYDNPGEEVEPAVPAVLPPLPNGSPNNRLGFAMWLVSPDNPLTARVTVNRFWQSFFGKGIVKTVEDFGSQGEPATHPELLDWLAVDFVESGWDVKRLVRKIVNSAAYRQSSAASSELIDKDPDNRLFARGPRFRLSAEVVRDQALAISGLLVEKVGGPSVKPYQPAGIWSDLAGTDYKQGQGDDLYRRTMYTFWKRSIAPPRMTLFDSAGREACRVLETRTNTPLQALNLMNDVTYTEAARMLAERMIKEGGETPAQRIGFAFRLATARPPSERETELLTANYRHNLDRFQTDQKAAFDMLKEGDHPRDETLDPSEVASYATVASLIFNLDETITKE